MRVYRVENEHGSGPYWGGIGLHEDLNIYLRNEIHDFKRHPGPQPLKDRIDNDKSVPLRLRSEWRYSDYNPFYYGFISPQQLKRWFHLPVRIRLDYEGGFMVKVYEVPDQYVYHNKHQAMFLRRKAKLGYDLPLARFHTRLKTIVDSL